jgi:hypothetical protein
MERCPSGQVRPDVSSKMKVGRQQEKSGVFPLIAAAIKLKISR